jgi:hypothetical protein
MRRTLIVGLAVFALLGVFTPRAFAQAPTPTFRINGLFDQVGTYASNVSNGDNDYHRKDTTFYGRTRGRWDIIGEYGKTKAVLGLEADLVYGQTGGTESNIAGGSNAGGTSTPPAAGATFVGNGTDGSAGLNTDVRGILEIKWLYTEFEVPLIPVPTTMRLGLQPFGSMASYKLSVYAASDFAGVGITSDITPNVRMNWGFVQVEEAMNGAQCGHNTNSCFGVSKSQLKGDDWATIMSPEISPIKGLDIKPLVSYFTASGTTSGNARQSRGGISSTAWFQNDDGTWRKGINEDRVTVGIDSRFRSGGFYLNPTVMYQFGSIDRLAPGSLPNAGPQNPTPFQDAGVTSGHKYSARIDAWLLDVRTGFQIGPLLLEAMYMYTTGNGPRNTQLGTTRSYQALTTDTGYMADWGGQMLALGVDYLQALGENSGAMSYPGVSIGYDKYGRQAISPRVTYSWTPTLTTGFGVVAHFTDRAVQEDATPTGGSLVPVFNCNKTANACGNGKSQYVGTELFAQVDWKFAPGVTWSNAGGYMSMGPAANAVTNPSQGPRDAKDAYILTSRVRFTF